MEHKLTYNSQTEALGQLVITRNGLIEEGHTDALESTMRREALKYAGTQAIQFVGHSLKLGGIALINGLDRMVTDCTA